MKSISVKSCRTCSKTGFAWPLFKDHHIYCSIECRTEGDIKDRIQKLSSTEIIDKAESLKKGTCKICKKEKKLEVYPSLYTVSVFGVFSYDYRNNLCCKKCGKTIQGKTIFTSIVSSIWGIHLLHTIPVSLVYNVYQLLVKRPEDQISEKLLNEAARILAKKKQLN